MHLVEKYGAWRSRELVGFMKIFVMLFLIVIKVRLNTGSHLMKLI